MAADSVPGPGGWTCVRSQQLVPPSPWRLSLPTPGPPAHLLHEGPFFLGIANMPRLTPTAGYSPEQWQDLGRKKSPERHHSPVQRRSCRVCLHLTRRTHPPALPRPAPSSSQLESSQACKKFSPESTAHKFPAVDQRLGRCKEGNTPSRGNIQ